MKKETSGKIHSRHCALRTIATIKHQSFSHRIVQGTWDQSPTAVVFAEMPNWPAVNFERRMLDHGGRIRGVTAPLLEHPSLVFGRVNPKYFAVVTAKADKIRWPHE